MKAAADEASTYAVDPIAGTTDADGHLDAVVPAATMEAVPAGTYVGEFAAELAGDVTIRVQIQVVVAPRVIV